MEKETSFSNRLAILWAGFKQERANLAEDWLLNEEKQEAWRKKVLSSLAFLFWGSGLIQEFSSFVTYFTYPHRQGWQFKLYLISGLIWIIGHFVAWVLARRGYSALALRLVLIIFFIGPTGYGSLGIEAYNFNLHAELLLLGIIMISLLSVRLTQQKLQIMFVATWFGMIIVQYIFRDYIAVPIPELIINTRLVITISSIVFTGVMILQYHRLSLPSKIVMGLMLTINIMHSVIMNYNTQTFNGIMDHAVATENLLTLRFILDCMIGGVALVAMLITQAVTRPLILLTDTALRVQQGGLTLKADIYSIDEIGELTKVFNQMVAKLRNTLDGLEDTVNARTRDLEVAFQVSKQITHILKLEELLPKLVEGARKGFDLKFVSVYLYNAENRTLILSTGAGDATMHTMSEAKELNIESHPSSIIAQAGRKKSAVIIKDTTQAPGYRPNPHLSVASHSEAAFPMIAQGELVGVLGVESTELNGFDGEDIKVLTLLAEQIGIAIKNAQLYEEQMHVADELKRVDQMKSMFLSSMSHELRTPLNAIINLVEMVATGVIGPVNQEQEELLQQVLGSSNHLLDLINDVLDISKIQAGKLTLFIEHDVNLHQEVDVVLKMISGLRKDKLIQLIQDIDPDLPKVSCDRRRVRQVLLNLLTNAFLFTESGSITLSIKNKSSIVEFAVCDTGPGIPQMEQELIFEPFIQTNERAKHRQGTGLGLPISRNLARAHGGEVRVESVEGEGSCFFFTLPVQNNRAEPE
jgi:signal transduction histidine kinase/HAMP domain-containing protein